MSPSRVERPPDFPLMAKKHFISGHVTSGRILTQLLHPSVHRWVWNFYEQIPVGVKVASTTLLLNMPTVEISGFFHAQAEELLAHFSRFHPPL